MAYDLAELPEMKRLAIVAELMLTVRTDATYCARTLVTMQTASDAELRDRWAPVIKETCEELQKASRALSQARALMESRQSGWAVAKPSKGLVGALVEVASSLSKLVGVLEVAETEVRARDTFIRLRGSMLSQLSREDRLELMLAARSKGVANG